MKTLWKALYWIAWLVLIASGALDRGW